MTLPAERTAALAFPGVTFAERGLQIEGGLDWDDYCRLCAMLEKTEGAVNWWIGDAARFGEVKWRDRYTQAFAVADQLGRPGMSVVNYAWVAGQFPDITRVISLSWSHYRAVAALPELAERVAWLEKAKANRWSLRDLERALTARSDPNPPPLPVGRWATIVADPPWPIEKIRRDATPAYQRQQTMDYPLMTVEQITAMKVSTIAADDAHLYLWTTHKHLPDALAVADAWGFKYQCLLTWVKNVGFTPFSWMYSTEHVLFCRRGNLDLLKMGLRVDFAAPRTVHSAKPDEFYELVRQASPGPRLELFARQPREGFDVWGNDPAVAAEQAEG